MKKIRTNIDQKDRVICVTTYGSHEFYYQSVNSKERIFLFSNEDFSGSVFAYFRDNGRNMNGVGFSLTIKELYEFKEYHNVKLTRVINRIPTMIDYALREELKQNNDIIRHTTIQIKAINNAYNGWVLIA